MQMRSTVPHCRPRNWGRSFNRSPGVGHDFRLGATIWGALPFRHIRARFRSDLRVLSLCAPLTRGNECLVQLKTSFPHAAPRLAECDLDDDVHAAICSPFVYQLNMKVAVRLDLHQRRAARPSYSSLSPGGRPGSSRTSVVMPES